MQWVVDVEINGSSLLSRGMTRKPEGNRFAQSDSYIPYFARIIIVAYINFSIIQVQCVILSFLFVSYFAL